MKKSTFAILSIVVCVVMAAAPVLASPTFAWAQEAIDSGQIVKVTTLDELGYGEESSVVNEKRDTSVISDFTNNDSVDSELVRVSEIELQSAAEETNSNADSDATDIAQKADSASLEVSAIVLEDDQNTELAPQAINSGVVADGIYIISSAKNPSRVLDVCGASKQSGANVLLWNDNGQTNQQWRVTFDQQTGKYSIISINSGLALAFAASKSGANVYQAQLTASASYLWSITSTSSGLVVSPAGSTGIALDIQGGLCNNGDNIELWSANNKLWQRYWFVAVSPKLKAEKTISEGVYTIARADAKSEMIDVENASQNDVANVLLYHSNDGFNQRWYVSCDKNNFYTLTSINSGKSLDICGVGRVPGSNVIQYSTHGRDNQKWQIRDNGNGTFSIISKFNGLALNASGTKDCSNINVFADTGSVSERFIFTESKLLGDGTYSISSRQNINEVIDVPNLSMTNGAQLALWNYNVGMNQKYQLVDQGNELYTVQVAHSGRYLEDASGKVVQKQKSGSTAQIWKASWCGTGVLLTNQATNRAITISGAVRNGAPLVTSSVTGSAAQRLSFSRRNLIEDGLYAMQSSTGKRVLDVDGVSKAENANLQLWSSNDGNNQKFTVSATSGGYYKIINLNSGKAVTASGSAVGSNVRQNGYSGSANQLWKAEIGPNGGIVFVDKQSGQALSVSGNANADGANVQLQSKVGSSGQVWNLIATKPHDAVLERARTMANSLGSSTNYFIAVDLANHRTMVFQRAGGAWAEVMNVTVSTGAPDTPTVTGTFSVGEKGYSFGSGYTCYYYTQFYGNYLFHSVLYNQGTFDVQDGRLGYSISHGCVRMNINDAHWIYDNVPVGTRVRVY